MRMRIVTFLTSAFVAGVVIMAASADVKCATGKCDVAITGSFVGEAYMDEGDATAFNRAYEQLQQSSCDDWCEYQCGAYAFYPGSSPSLYTHEALWTPNNTGSSGQYVHVISGICPCTYFSEGGGIPMSVRPSERVPLTFGQKIQRLIGGLFQKPKPPKGGRIGG